MAIIKQREMTKEEYDELQRETIALNTAANAVWAAMQPLKASQKLKASPRSAPHQCQECGGPSWTGATCLSCEHDRID